MNSTFATLLSVLPILGPAIFFDNEDSCHLIPEQVEFCGVKVDLGLACGKHNHCYASCGRTQKQCDDELNAEILELCKQKLGKDSNETSPCLERCTETAKMYESGIQSSGQARFKEEQARANCTVT